MYLGRNSYTLSELRSALPQRLIDAALDVIKHDAPKHLINGERHTIHSQGFNTHLELRNGVLKAWDCNCMAFAKKNVCVHTCIGVLLLDNHKKNSSKNQINKSISSFQALQKLSADDQGTLLLRICQMDSTLDQMIKIFALYLDEQKCDDNQLREGLEHFLLPSQLPKSRPKSLKQFKNTRIWHELYQKHLTNLPAGRRWTFLFFLLRYVILLDQKIKTKTTNKFVQDLHQEAYHFINIGLAPELQELVVKDFRRLATESYYKHLIPYNVYQFLATHDDLSDKILAHLEIILRDQQMPLAQWEALLHVLLLDDNPEKALQLLENLNFPWSTLFISLREKRDLETLSAWLLWCDSAESKDHPFQATLLSHLDYILSEKPLAVVYLNSVAIQSALNESDRLSSLQIDNQTKTRLKYALWSLNDQHEEIGRLLQASDNIDDLLALNDQQWLLKGVYKEAPALLSRYLEVHHGSIPRTKVAELLARSSQIGLDKTYSLLTEVVEGWNRQESLVE